ncbi:hypothetical protein [Spirochaeta africana]|uniref:Cupin domain-containing protein n=1 Tax=Spirochaeta africana (strain ATCC 700263 / DSM 8902 / Z-7692) TaxID=889378 RepID=H9UH10_SPIAZ|nr:hypothetical protein [Spirochaeta africana]AFG36803.1 hypothetical protein Spiaf_0703 [Spirochaeta africana DSM 8902]
MTGTRDILVEVHEYIEDGYRPVVDYNGWRVAVLNYHPELLPENLQDFQRHDETDEVFILVCGRCLLLTGDGTTTVGTIHAMDLEPGKVYNVKRGVWHSHTLSRDARVMIVENTDTGEHNSPRCMLTEEHKRRIVELAAEHGYTET